MQPESATHALLALDLETCSSISSCSMATQLEKQLCLLPSVAAWFHQAFGQRKEIIHQHTAISTEAAHHVSKAACTDRFVLC